MDNYQKLDKIGEGTYTLLSLILLIYGSYLGSLPGELYHVMSYYLSIYYVVA